MIIRRLVSTLLVLLVGCSADSLDARQDGADAHSVETDARYAGSDARAAASDGSVAIPVRDGGAVLCLTDVDCANGNPCATAHCVITGEIGMCEFTPVTDGASCPGSVGCPGSCHAGACLAATCAGVDAGVPHPMPDAGVDHPIADAGPVLPMTGMPQPPIDTACPATCPYGSLPAVFPLFTALLPRDVPASCSNGFELGGASGGCGRATYTLHSTRAGGANAITLDVDFATYLVPDGVTVTGIDAAGHSYTLLRTCRLQTWDQPGPSDRRPPDESIRQFRLNVRAGTTQLDFDFGAVTSPTYMRVVGLCDFGVTRFANAAFWQAVP